MSDRRKKANGRDRRDDEPVTNGANVPATVSPLTPVVYRTPDELQPEVPRTGDTWLDRRRARKFEESLKIATKTNRAAKEYIETETAVERAAQNAERVYQQQQFLPALLELDRQQVLGQLTDACAAREWVQDKLERQRRLALYAEEMDQIRHDTERLRLLAERRQAEVALQRAGELGSRGVDVTLARTDAERYRHLDEVDEIRAVMRERGAPPPAPNPKPAPVPVEGDPIPPEYAHRMEIETNVGRIIRQGEQDLAEIDSRRVAEGRKEYTSDELERIDAIKNAMDAASGDVRRGGASDVRPRKGGK